MKTGLLAVAMLLAAVPGLSQCMLKVSVTSSPNSNTTSYQYTLDKANAAAVCSPKQVWLPVSSAWSTLKDPVPNGICLEQSVNKMTTYGIGNTCSAATPMPALPLVFVLEAPTDHTQPYPTSNQYMITDAAGKTYQDFIDVPVDISEIPPVANPVASNPDTVDLLAGVGSHVAFDIPVDYSVETNSVLASNGVGRAVPVLLAGLGFTFRSVNLNPKGLKADLGRVVPNTGFVSLQFPTGNGGNGQTPIDGYTFGAGYKLQPYLELMVGYSLAPEMEPSYGFRQAAAQVVKNNQDIAIYQRYNPASIMDDKPNALDGFPLLLQTAQGPPGGPIYPGGVLETHYRGGLFLGVSFPFSLTKSVGH